MTPRIKILITCFMTIITMLIVAPSNAQDGLFKSKEFKSTKTTAFKKWHDLLKRHGADIANTAQSNSETVKTPDCLISNEFKCLKNEWKDILTNLESEPARVKMATVNRHLNKATYITDIVNWNQNDYWATIRQFFIKEGDCEDYAIAKYYSLKKLGFNPSQMRIVVVQDTNLNVAHAVLAVYFDGKIWILDNQISRIITDDKIVHYKPLYSINEHAWWLHKI